MTRVNKQIHTSNSFKSDYSKEKITKNIYWGEVVSISDDSDGGIIKVKIPEFDQKLNGNNVPDAYPLLPKFFHVYPQVGEVVRVFIEDITVPTRSRYWIGSVVSQLHKINFESLSTALNTTNLARGRAEKAISQYPEAKGVFPTVKEIGLIGRNNTDVLLKDNEVLIRAGKHELNDVFKLNKQNPAAINLIFEETPDGESDTRSTSMILGDKIMLIAHSGKPKFKAANFTKEDRDNMISKAHPLSRGDVLLQFLEVFRSAILTHTHPYDRLSPDEEDAIKALKALPLERMLQENILIN